jgi:hypothetical protein
MVQTGSDRERADGRLFPLDGSGALPMKSSAWCLGIIAWSLFPAPDAGADDGASRALILVGLPGDPAHDALFRDTAKRWKAWLVGPLGFAPENVRLLSGRASEQGIGDAPATRESIASEVESLRKKTLPGDRVWVLVLGHANLDDGHGFLHLPGPDLRDDEFAALFHGMVAREQVFWMTTPASGAFLGPLSRSGRIVVAATERSGEVNETEFPHALAEVAARPLARLDLDKDGKVSIREVFLATVEAVETRFQADKRAPTEHAQLDDDGDGVGTELQSDPKTPKPDGALASKTFLPIVAPKIPPKPPSRSENGTVPPRR